MLEASSRLLVDRSVVRVDGRPFFTFGPRVLLTAAEDLGAACGQIAAGGFTCVESMPASPGTAWVVSELFDQAERFGLLVVLSADTRFRSPGRFLAERFRSRTNLHSYRLAWDDEDDGAMDRFLCEREAIRAIDLFHPVWAPMGRRRPDSQWLRSMDIYAVSQSPNAASEPDPPSAAERLSEVARLCRPPSVSRPLFCSALPVGAATADRRAGLYDDDPALRGLGPDPASWFPGYASFATDPRRDLLPPEPALVRLRMYELLAHGARGVLLDHFEAMGGPVPFTGADRMCEASILAQEAAVLRDFFAEGTVEMCLIEPGHPRLRASVIRHGEDLLILLRGLGEWELGCVGECQFARVEVDIRTDTGRPLNAWRVDFPRAYPVGVVQDAHRTLRIACGPVDMTAALLLTPGRTRAEEIGAGVDARLPQVARWAVESARAQLEKVELIEGELVAERRGVHEAGTLARARASCAEAEALLADRGNAAAFAAARRAEGDLRHIMRVQLTRARLEPIFRPSPRREQLRRAYHLLPQFYRESGHESQASDFEFT